MGTTGQDVLALPHVLQRSCVVKLLQQKREVFIPTLVSSLGGFGFVRVVYYTILKTLTTTYKDLRKDEISKLCSLLDEKHSTEW
jgi:hypothetical protein